MSANDAAWGPEDVRVLAQADLLLMSARILAGSGAPVTDAAQEDSGSVRQEDLVVLLEEAGVANPGTRAETFCQALAEAQGDLVAWQAEETRLFGSNAVCPTYECSFIRRDKGQILGDIAGFYRAFHFHVDPSVNERPDHVACELEFAAMLMVMTVLARRNGSLEKATIAQEGLHAFVADHLGDWLPAFVFQLREVSSLPVYRILADLIDSTWLACVSHQRLPVEPMPPDLVSCSDGEAPFECPQAVAAADPEPLR